MRSLANLPFAVLLTYTGVERGLMSAWALPLS